MGLNEVWQYGVHPVWVRGTELLLMSLSNVNPLPLQGLASECPLARDLLNGALLPDLAGCVQGLIKAGRQRSAATCFNAAGSYSGTTD